MEFIPFVETVSEEVQKKIGDTYHISVVKNKKNNSVELTGIVFHKENENASPTIYINDLFEQFMNQGKKMNQIVSDVMERYEKSREALGDMSCLNLDFNTCKEQIIYRLVSREKNKAELESVPHIPFLDLAITFHIVISYENEFMQSLKITDQIVDKLGLSVGQLLKLAAKNTEKILPLRMENLDEMVSRFVVGRTEEQLEFETEPVEDNLTNPSKMDMIVISNEIGISGAAAILYDGLIEKVADKFCSNLYLIPSSIHEMIVVPENGEEDMYELLCCMVKDINAKFVDKDEILSDRVYIYMREEKKFI